MDNGWIKLHRKIMGSQVWRNPDLYQVWCWCLLKANHKETWLSVTTGKGSTQVKLLPGQFIYGRKSAAKDLKMKPESIRNRMQKLQNMENLTIQPTTHYSIVTICNWDEYQSIENETNHPLDHAETTQPPTKDQPKATDKNVKNDKNVKEDKVLSSVPQPDTEPQTLDLPLQNLLDELPTLALVGNGNSSDFWDGIYGAVFDYKLDVAWLFKELRAIDRWQTDNPDRASRSVRGMRQRISTWVNKALDKMTTTRRA